MSIIAAVWQVQGLGRAVEQRGAGGGEASEEAHRRAFFLTLYLSISVVKSV